MSNIFDELPENIQNKLSQEKQPQTVSPMLATLTHEPFSRKDWIFERKLDGERCLAFKNSQNVTLKSRNNKDLNSTYPEIREALEKQAEDDCVLDGEIVTFEGNRTSFSRLQNRMKIKDEKQARESRIAVYYYIFDIIYKDGFNLQEIPLHFRKSLLKQSVSFNDPVRYTIHRNEEGQKFLKEACDKGWEGIIAKDAESSYVNSRSRKWQKLKCVNRQEFVIGGYTDPEGSRLGFGALLIGYYEGGDLHYAGKVGTGFSDLVLDELHDKLKKIVQSGSPFSGEVSEKNVHWVEPRLVAEIGFTEWTEDLRLRHPRYIGLRNDKEPQKVYREK